MSTEISVRPSEALKNVRYEIRGKLARRAHEMERQGYEIISLNIGNPRLFGFRTPETMRLAMIENLSEAEGYCHQKGIFPAREAVVMQQQGRGITGVTAEEVFIGKRVRRYYKLTEPGVSAAKASIDELVAFLNTVYRLITAEPMTGYVSTQQ